MRKAYRKGRGLAWLDHAAAASVGIDEVLDGFRSQAHLSHMAQSYGFAERTHAMRRSSVRELLKLSARSDVVSLGGGVPAPELLPVAETEQALRSLTSSGALFEQALQYSESEGLPELRTAIAERCAAMNDKVRPENVLVVSGSQQALDLLGRVLIDPFDRVAVEQPTYLALLSAWRPLGPALEPIAGDADGIAVDDLAANPPKLLYVIPSFQNPRGTTLCDARRRALVRAASERGFLVVEDHAYAPLRYEGAELPPLLSLDRDGAVVHAATFSKVLMPGLRVGYVVAPEPIIEKLVQAKQAADLHTSTLGQLVVAELLRRGVLEQRLPLLRERYRARRDAMLDALERHMPREIRFTRPEGGFFIWLELPHDLDAAALLTEALAAGVAYVPGADFCAKQPLRNALRLSFSFEPEHRIELGIKRLARVLEKAPPLRLGRGAPDEAAGQDLRRTNHPCV
jgi:2-aminoadipate transaminase